MRRWKSKGNLLAGEKDGRTVRGIIFLGERKREQKHNWNVFLSGQVDKNANFKRINPHRAQKLQICEKPRAIIEVKS